jgi:hypothetical protein
MEKPPKQTGHASTVKYWNDLLGDQATILLAEVHLEIEQMNIIPKKVTKKKRGI